MGKQLQTFPVIYPGTNNIGFPVKAGTWDFLQAAYNEQFASVIQNLIINITGNYYPGVVYVIDGMEVTVGSSISNWTVNSDAAFYNGELFQCIGGSFSWVSGQIAVANLLNTPFTESDSGGTPMADPVSFIGGPIKDVHISRTITFVSGVSGSGTFSGSASTTNDYTSLVYIELGTLSPNNNLSTILSLFTSSGLVFGSGCSNAGGSYYDVAYKITGNECVLSGVISCVSISGTATVLTLPFSITNDVRVICDTDAGSSYYVLKISTSGAIVFDNGGSFTGNIYLDGVTFRIF